MFARDSIRAFKQLKVGTHATGGLIVQKLAPQLLKHESGKDAIAVIIKDRSKGLHFSNLEGQPGVKTLPFDQLRPHAPNTPDATVSTDPPLPASIENPQGEYTKAEQDAVAKIKQVWLSCSPKIKRRRSYISDPECRAIARYFNMSASCPATTELRDRIAMRRLLVSRGVSLRLRLDAGRESLSRLQRDAMACVENVEVSVGVFESVDGILGRNREVELLLKRAEENMSEESLMGLVKDGVLSALEKALKNVEDVIAEIERSLLETRKMIDAVSCS